MNYYQNTLSKLSKYAGSSLSYAEATKAHLWINTIKLLGEHTFNTSIKEGDYSGDYDQFWTKWHKCFLQFEVSQDVVRLGDRRRIADSDELDAYVDMLAWHLVSIDTSGILYNLIKELTKSKFKYGSTKESTP